MSYLRDLPVRRKLMLVTMFTVGAALFLAAVVAVVQLLRVHREKMALDLATTARMLGDASASAIAFDDPVAARRSLLALAADPRLVAAALYDGRGRLFATWQAPAPAGTTVLHPLSALPDGQRFGDDSLEVFRTVIVAGERAGAVYLRANLTELQEAKRRYAGIVALAMTLAMVAAHLMSDLLHRLVTAPIAHLAGVVGKVGRAKDYSIRALRHGDDDVGRLITGFNEMLEQIEARDHALRDARDHLERRVAERTDALAAAHREMLDLTRQAGMAEIASNVLHNVGNALNSVNVSAGVIRATLAKPTAASLERVVDLLRANERDLPAFLTGDPRGRHVLPHLAQVAQACRADHTSIVSELASLTDNIDHIKEVVAMQQQYARVGAVEESVSLPALVEDCLKMSADAMMRHGVQVVRECEDLPPMRLEKHKLLQILMNLLTNARQACDESGRADHRIVVRVTRATGGARVEVADNGVGIPPENLTRIFEHGFTTRKTGHGFGLHGSALAAKGMGGSLSVHSDGPGRGATFTLEIPGAGSGAHGAPHADSPVGRPMAAADAPAPVGRPAAAGGDAHD